jgi:tetratricopeptide (TPR) repeat protein
MAMYQVILCVAAALLVATAVQSASADDASVCESEKDTGARFDEKMEACGRVCESGMADASARWATDDERIEACGRMIVFSYYRRAATYTSKHDYDRAIADLDQAIRLDPKLVPAYYNRGMVYDFKLDYDRAIADFDQALKLDPKASLTYLSRGIAYRSKGDYDSAIADFGQAIRTAQYSDASANAYVRRSEAHNRKGDYDRAIADANEAIRLFPEYADAYNNRGEANEGKNDLDHAIADFDQAQKLAEMYTGDVEPLLAKARQGLERVQALLAKRSNPGAQTNAPPR